MVSFCHLKFNGVHDLWQTPSRTPTRIYVRSGRETATASTVDGMMHRFGVTKNAGRSNCGHLDQPQEVLVGVPPSTYGSSGALFSCRPDAQSPILWKSIAPTLFALWVCRQRQRQRHECVEPHRSMLAPSTAYRWHRGRKCRSARRARNPRERDADGIPATGPVSPRSRVLPRSASGPAAMSNWEVMAEQNAARTGGFKKFLLVTEREMPLWYMVSDWYLTVVGAFCFYASVAEPKLAAAYHLCELEDIINVNFLIKFLLLFWANDSDRAWFMTGKAQLDLFSCLPVLCIVGRAYGGPTLEKTLDLLQIFRFLRLLRETLPSGVGGKETRTNAQAPLQIFVVLLALFGTVALSATILLLYEWAPDNPNVMAYEDAVLYMVNVISGRQPAFDPSTIGGKRVTVAATVVGVIFLPFLIRSSLSVFLGDKEMSRMASVSAGFASVPVSYDTKERFVDGPIYWAGVLRRIDMLENTQRVSADEARRLRRLCLQENAQLQTLDVCYAADLSEDTPDERAWALYAKRLKEWLADSCDVEQ